MKLTCWKLLIQVNTGNDLTSFGLIRLLDDIILFKKNIHKTHTRGHLRVMLFTQRLSIKTCMHVRQRHVFEIAPNVPCL